jgi:hypothetical protein
MESFYIEQVLAYEIYRAALALLRVLKPLPLYYKQICICELHRQAFILRLAKRYAWRYMQRPTRRGRQWRRFLEQSRHATQPSEWQYMLIAMIRDK